MGNSQSSGASGGPCPSKCSVLCWGSAPAVKDDGEWFGDLPREKKKRKNKSRSKRNIDTMPVVPEESDTAEGSTEDDSFSLEPSEYRASAIARKSSERVARRKSEGPGAMTKKKKNPKRQPTAKLTFVNGQFVDGSTREGKEIVAAASLEEGGGSIGGIVNSYASGHAGILGPSSSSEARGESESTPAFSFSLAKSIGAVSKIGRSVSDTSAASGSGSVTSASIGSASSISQPGSALSTSADTRDAITSIVALGEGHFLTASKSDRVIKMWKIESDNVNIKFIRDFVGHSTGVTCLTKVDDKGRFLSASKDRVIKLWDSRFSCGDSSEEVANASHQILLATFPNCDKRAIRDITIIEDGKYVRPTDNLDMAMAVSMTKKAMLQGSASVQKAAQERQIIACSCEFATISGRHPVAKMWAANHVEQEDGRPPWDTGNVAEVKAAQELKHDTVVESIASVQGKGLLLTGDRMGTVKLWVSTLKVFLPGAAKVWTCTRTFSWRLKSQLSSVEESLQFAITSLTFLQGDTMFVSGSRAGNLRVWKVEGKKKNAETYVNKEEICITGAHNLPITAIQQGPDVNSVKDSISFSSASEDGKVLSFAVPVAKIGKSNPCCFNVVNHGIADRYIVGTEPKSVMSLACLSMPNKAGNVLVTGSTGSNGAINVLKTAITAKKGQKNDALMLHREAMEDESLTLYDIAEKLSNGGVESRDRKLQMKSYKNCVVGKEVVTYLVDNGYAASRNDGITLGNVLVTHLSLFECVTKKCKMLVDSDKAYYRFTSDATGNSGPGMKKWSSMK